MRNRQPSNPRLISQCTWQEVNESGEWHSSCDVRAAPYRRVRAGLQPSSIHYSTRTALQKPAPRRAFNKDAQTTSGLQIQPEVERFSRLTRYCSAEKVNEDTQRLYAHCRIAEMLKALRWGNHVMVSNRLKTINITAVIKDNGSFY